MMVTHHAPAGTCRVDT